MYAHGLLDILERRLGTGDGAEYDNSALAGALVDKAFESRQKRKAPEEYGVRIRKVKSGFFDETPLITFWGSFGPSENEHFAGTYFGQNQHRFLPGGGFVPMDDLDDSGMLALVFPDGLVHLGYLPDWGGFPGPALTLDIFSAKRINKSNGTLDPMEADHIDQKGMGLIEGYESKEDKTYITDLSIFPNFGALGHVVHMTGIEYLLENSTPRVWTPTSSHAQ